LLDKGFPSSLSEFKDHPLYVLKKHLLKYQSIYPQEITPAGMFRDKPIYYRDNLVTLHSGQTWLKLARVVKPFDKTYKVVKGKLQLKQGFKNKLIDKN
jgi:xeroderma pigmentosum group C-complementing protein